MNGSNSQNCQKTITARKQNAIYRVLGVRYLFSSINLSVNLWSSFIRGINFSLLNSKYFLMNNPEAEPRGIKWNIYYYFFTAVQL